MMVAKQMPMQKEIEIMRSGSTLICLSHFLLFSCLQIDSIPVRGIVLRYGKQDILQES